MLAFFVRDIWHKYHLWYFKIVSNFTRVTVREITFYNFDISLVVFITNITTNHPNTYINWQVIKCDHSHDKIVIVCWRMELARLCLGHVCEIVSMHPFPKHILTFMSTLPSFLVSCLASTSSADWRGDCFFSRFFFFGVIALGASFRYHRPLTVLD